MYKNEKQIAEGIFRLTVASSAHFEFSQFLIMDEKTCLIHAGKVTLFTSLKQMVDEKLDGRSLDYIVFSHVEADESGAANNWLEAFPKVQVICNKVANINLEDFLIRPARILKDGEILQLGSKSLQLINTPHFPHNWDAHLWYEINNKILFSSDFCCQGGNTEPIVNFDISPSIIEFYSKGGFMPYGKTTNETVQRLAALQIEMIAPMHGSVIKGVVCKTILNTIQADLLQCS